ncbi:MAG: glycosyltransferase family 4 protein [Longimicrobiales bacterium]
MIQPAAPDTPETPDTPASMRILLLVNQFPPDVNPAGKLMHALARGLVMRGHRVHVVTAFPHYAEFRIWPEYRRRWWQHTLEDGVCVTRLRVFASGQKQRMGHRLASYVSYNAAAFLAAHSSTAEFDVMLAPNGSFFTGLTAAALGALRRIPFVYNVQDVYPDVPARAGQLPSATQVQWLERIERFMYRAAEHVTVIAESQRDNLLAKRVSAGKLSVIPNFVDVERIQPQAPDEELRARLGWTDRFVVVHSGNLGFAYDFDTLLQAARLMLKEPQTLFVIIGDGVRKPELVQRAQSLGLGNVQFLPFQPEADLPRLRASAHVQLSLYRPGASRLSLPSKLYEIMAAAQPILASAEPDSDVAHLVQHAGAGLMVEPDQPEQLVAAVRALREAPAMRQQLGERGRAHVSAHHSLRSALDAYEALLWRCSRQR